MGKLIGFESMIKNYHMIVKQSVAVDVFVDLLIKLNPILASRQMRSLCDDMRPRLSRLLAASLSLYRYFRRDHSFIVRSRSL